MSSIFMDVNLWGIFAMPVGLLLGFGPVLIAWMLHERGNASKNPPKDHK